MATVGQQAAELILSHNAAQARSAMKGDPSTVFGFAVVFDARVEQGVMSFRRREDKREIGRLNGIK